MIFFSKAFSRKICITLLLMHLSPYNADGLTIVYFNEKTLE